MNNREKLENLKLMLDTLIITCKSEISLTEKMIAKEKSTKEISRLEKEKIFWQGKLDVAKYARMFAD